MLIVDLLELSKIENAQFKLDLEDMSLKDITEDVFELVRGKAEEKGMHLHIQEQGSSVIEGDWQRLKQVVLNLVSNAIAYTPSGGHVTVALKEQRTLLF